MPAPFAAAVTLSYDDAIHEHLDHVLPDLEAHGLRGTFYVPTGGGPERPWHARRAEWVAAAGRGHEIGNHTRFHPCRNCPGTPDLKTYSLAQIEDEIRAAQADLDTALGQRPRSFAYTCGDETVGPDHSPVSFLPLLRQLFPLARTGGNVLVDLSLPDPWHITSLVVLEDTPLPRVLHFIDLAIAERKWAVLTFHGIGGGHGLNYPRDAHQTLCRHIAQHQNELHCDTLINIGLALREGK